MKLPTAEQWLEIAEAFGTPYTGRTPSQLRLTTELGNKKRVRTGMCNALWSGFSEALMEYADWFCGQSSYFWHCEDGYGERLYVWPCTNAGDRQRAFFCMLMAAITEAGDMADMVKEGK